MHFPRCCAARQYSKNTTRSYWHLLKGEKWSFPRLSQNCLGWSFPMMLRNTWTNWQLLTFKLVMLLSLTRPSRLADLAALQLDRCRYMPEGVAFLPATLAKQSSQGRVLRKFIFPFFPLHTNLRMSCGNNLQPDSSKLFVAIKKPHKPVASCTITRWLKKTLKLAGIDVSIFQVTQLGEHQLQLQQEPALLWMRSCRLQIRVHSQCSESSTTDLPMMCHGRTVILSHWWDLTICMFLYCGTTMKWPDFTHNSYK